MIFLHILLFYPDSLFTMNRCNAVNSDERLPGFKQHRNKKTTMFRLRRKLANGPNTYKIMKSDSDIRENHISANSTDVPFPMIETKFDIINEMEIQNLISQDNANEGVLQALTSTQVLINLLVSIILQNVTNKVGSQNSKELKNEINLQNLQGLQNLLDSQDGSKEINFRDPNNFSILINLQILIIIQRSVNLGDSLSEQDNERIQSLMELQRLALVLKSMLNSEKSMNEMK